jgi:hypothetical protein
MKHLIDDAMKLGRATMGLFMGFSPKGRLLKAVRVSRPNWPERACSHAATVLAGDGVKQSHQFVSKLDYLSYIDIKLTRYAAQHPVVEALLVADELGQKRWEQRWQASRQRPVAQQDKHGDASFHRAA